MDPGWPLRYGRLPPAKVRTTGPGGVYRRRGFAAALCWTLVGVGVVLIVAALVTATVLACT